MKLQCLLATFFALPALTFPDVHYTLEPEPVSSTVRVTVQVDNPKDEESFNIPAWCPGFYFLLRYEDKINDFSAVDAQGRALGTSHARGSRQWTVLNPKRAAFTVTYRVTGDDPGLGFFGTNVQKSTAFVNGASAFMYVTGRLTEPAHLHVHYGADLDEWRTASPLDAERDAPVPATGDVDFRASGYDELIDSPIQMGHFETRSFVQAGVPFTVVFVSKDQQYRPNLDEETARFKALALPALQLFGGAPFKRYIFYVHLAIGNFSGGLEHRACNVQAVSNTRPLDIDDLAAHEYFHAWNVKQIRPKILGPFDYSGPQRTANLWFAEGVTDYYAQLTTYRSGLHDSTWLLRQLQAQIRELQFSPTRLKVTLADCSRQTWEHGGFGYDDLSYYTKGLLVGWIFDAVIRDETDGEKSLDDVMRLLYKRYRLPGPGYEEGAILQVLNEVSGQDQTALYNRMVASVEELPYEELQRIGISVDPAGWVVKTDPRATAKAKQLGEAWLERPSGVR